MARDLEIAGQAMRKSILYDEEEQQENIAQAIKEEVASKESSLDTALYKIDTVLNQFYNLVPKKPLRGIWHTASKILLNSSDIDCIQATYGGDLAALIVVSKAVLYPVVVEPLVGDISLVVLKAPPGVSASGALQTYMGVRSIAGAGRAVESSGASAPSALIDPVEALSPPIYLFSWDKALQLPSEYEQLLQGAKGGSLSPDERALIKEVAAAKEKLKELVGFVTGGDTSQVKQYLADIIQHDTTVFKDPVILARLNSLTGAGEGASPYRQFFQPLGSSVNGSDGGLSSSELQGGTQKDFAVQFLESSQRVNVVNLVHELTRVANSDLPEFEPFGELAPVGVARVVTDRFSGIAILAKDVFYPHAFMNFNDASYYQQHPPINPVLPIASSLAVISSPQTEQVFLANTMQVSSRVSSKDGEGETVGYITVGDLMNSFLKRLAMQSNRTVLFVSGSEIKSACNEKGEFLPSEMFQGSIEEMVKLGGGSVLIGAEGSKENYLFYRVPVLGKSDVHLFIMQPETKAYGLLQALQGMMADTTRKISAQLLIVLVGLFFVSLGAIGKISKNISEPISLLAKATMLVAEGSYDAIRLPPSHKVSADVSTLMKSFDSMVTGLRDREKVRDVLNKVVSKDIAAEILRGDIHLGGEEKMVTMLFSDIRGFTRSSEKLSPQVVITRLNRYMTRMTAVINNYNGVIDKYVGDEIMALYGAPVALAQGGLKAVQSGIDMMRALKKLNEESLSKGEPAIHMGIGIHTGVVVAGSMGAEDRLNYTVLGANVNLAARLCNGAAPGEILISKHTLNEPEVHQNIQIISSRQMEFKGFTDPMTVYSVRYD